MEETKICKECGRELPLDKFELMRPNTERAYYLRTCKECRYKYMKALKQKKREVKISDDLQILIKRSYKEINPKRILDISGLDITLLGDDEIFVKKMDCKDFWLSNYGRGIKYYNGKYHLLKPHVDANGALSYRVQKEYYCNGGFKRMDYTMYVAQAVAQEFVVNPDCYNNIFIWHRGYDKTDNYYKNLYPLNKEQYFAVRRNYEKTGDDSEEFILKIMNEIRYATEDWSIKSLEPVMCGIGYHGSAYEGSTLKSFKCWRDMMQRCYNDKFHERQPQYADCSVCEEWWNYSNFKKWYDENYYQIPGLVMDLDKDILIKGNKVYSPSTCCFVPHNINTLFINGKKNRGEFPLGVYWDSEKSKYRVEMAYCGNDKKIGTYNTVDEAFAHYKSYKEDFIKNVAEQYNGKIPHKVYEAMLNWKIEITD